MPPNGGLLVYHQLHALSNRRYENISQKNTSFLIDYIAMQIIYKTLVTRASAISGNRLRLLISAKLKFGAFKTPLATFKERIAWLLGQITVATFTLLRYYLRYYAQWHFVRMPQPNLKVESEHYGAHWFLRVANARSEELKIRESLA